jgi:hypothetical protein
LDRKRAFLRWWAAIENRGESTPQTRKSQPPSLKAKVAVEAIKAHMPAAQIGQIFSVHATEVGGWKKQAHAGLSDIFGKGQEQVRQHCGAPAERFGRPWQPEHLNEENGIK